ncbi:MAG: PhnD/SsuA/transferrin family substrate-binding protein, partial [Arcobacteraceae bacterium]
MLFLLNSFNFASSLKLGIFPYTDPMQLIKIHNDLREHLSNELGYEIEIYTAQDFVQYYDNTKNEFYD